MEQFNYITVQAIILAIANIISPIIKAYFYKKIFPKMSFKEYSNYKIEITKAKNPFTKKDESSKIT